VVIVYIDCFDCVCTLKESWTLSGSCVNEISRYCRRDYCGNIPCLSAYIGCQLLANGSLRSSITHSSEDARPPIVDTPLTLIFKMGHRRYCNLFCLSRRPIMTSWLSATYRPSDYTWCKTKNCWCSIDVHFQDGVGSVWLEFLPINAANALIMYNHDHIDS